MACEKQDYWTKVSLWEEEADTTEWSLASTRMLWHIPLLHSVMYTHSTRFKKLPEVPGRKLLGLFVVHK